MSLDYGIIALICLCMVGVCVLSDQITDAFVAAEDNLIFGIREGQEACPIFTEEDDYYSTWWGSVGSMMKRSDTYGGITGI